MSLLSCLNFGPWSEASPGSSNYSYARKLASGYAFLKGAVTPYWSEGVSILGSHTLGANTVLAVTGRPQMQSSLPRRNPLTGKWEECTPRWHKGKRGSHVGTGTGADFQKNVNIFNAK
jgi:hypothetical protein